MKGLFLGLSTIDLLYPVDHFPVEDSKVKAANYYTFLGGPATNAAITFAALGGNATLVSAIGDNHWSHWIQDRLKGFGVTFIDLIPGLPYPAQLSSVIINQQNGSRTILTCRATPLPAEASTPDLDINAYDVCCIDGFYADRFLPVLAERSASLPVVFDGGSFKEGTDEILQWVDYPILAEWFAFPGEVGIRQGMSERGICHFAITHGDKPMHMYGPKGHELLEVPSIDAVDTLGAGDIFHGAFSWYIGKENGDFRQALLLSSRIAAESCRYFGPRTWMEFSQSQLHLQAE